MRRRFHMVAGVSFGVLAVLACMSALLQGETAAGQTASEAARWLITMSMIWAATMPPREG